MIRGVTEHMKSSDRQNGHERQRTSGLRATNSPFQKNAGAGALAVATLLMAGTAALAQQTTQKAAAAAAPPAAAAHAPAAAAPEGRGNAYYHFGLAHMYEELAVNSGRGDYATRAIEEYKLALNADPDSPFLNNGYTLAEPAAAPPR